MNTEIFGIVVMFVLSVALAIPLGKYIAKVYGGERTFMDTVFRPVDRLLLKLGCINPTLEMTWKQHLLALLTINLVWFLIGMLVLMTQGWLPLNPDNNPSMSPDLAFNTSISFLVNCNLQHYAGENGVSYLSQMWLMFMQFVSAGTGMAAAAVVFRAFRDKTSTTLGNFYDYFIKSCTRILLPISLLVAIILVFEGVPMTFEGQDHATTLEGQNLGVSRGPAAAFVAIKHTGTNGGGFFGANSAHPLENPTYLTNMVEMIAQFVIPLAMVFAFGYFTRRKRLSWMIFWVMTVGFLLLTIPTIIAEMRGNPAIQAIGIDNSQGAMEGKEVRIGAAASGFWSIVTTVISTGSVNCAHDSMMPVSGMSQLLGMMANSFYGGVGVGILNILIFIVLAVFISGLMVGRTPEFLGKKIEVREMKIAMIIALIHPFLILAGTALAIASPAVGAVGNPGFHGFSEILYEFTSTSANNGSTFGGLRDTSAWWNISTGVVLLLSRYIPIIGSVAIAGLLARKKFTPEGDGTLRTDTATFGLILFVVILIVALLSFLPAVTIGPVAEYFTLY